MTYSDTYNLRTTSVKFNDVADAIDGSITRPFGGSTSGTSTAYTASPTPAWNAYDNASFITVIPNVTNTVGSPSVTINVSGLGTRAIKRGGADLVAGVLVQSIPTILVYTGTYFEVIAAANSLLLDGSSVMLNDLNFGGFKPINLAAGTAGSPAICAGNDIDTGLFSPAANQIGISTGGSERVRINSSGNVGVGTTSPSEKLHIVGNQIFSQSVGSTIASFIASGTAVNLDLVAGASTYGSNGAGIRLKNSGATDNGEITFSTNLGGTGASTRLKITNDGSKSFENGYHYYTASGITSGAGTNALKYHTTTGLVTWDSSSRLVKDNIVDCPYGLSAILALQPRKYFRKDDQCNELGFVADEVTQIIPELVSHCQKSRFTKNEADTEIVPSSLSYEKLTSVLVKAIQELNAKVVLLEQEQ